ncbi:MAG: D-alanine--D-alanine ligase [bacterium]
MNNLINLQKRNIAILSGGYSKEREVSLRSGKAVFEALKKHKLKPILIDPQNKNFIQDFYKYKIDLVFMALHGGFGENGSIQGLLNLLNITYTGSDVEASALAMNKILTKGVLKENKIPIPSYYVINNKNLQDECKNILKKFSLPIVLKPSSEGSSFGVFIIKEEKKLFSTIKKIQQEFKQIFIEKFIKGRNITIGILGKEVLPILELRPKTEFYDYKAKYTAGLTEFIIPAPFPKHIYEKIQKLAFKTHEVLGCKDISRIDMIIDENNKPFVLEVNTLPGLTDLSDFPAQAKTANISYDELILKILNLAIEREIISKEKNEK